MVPAEAFKCGITVEIAVTFHWIHDGVGFQMTSNSIMYIIKKQEMSHVAYFTPQDSLLMDLVSW